MTRQDNVSTGMAGEFHTMEILYRLGYSPALTLGNTKTVDIFVRVSEYVTVNVSVKSMRGGGKWGVGKTDYSREHNLIFVLLHYSKWNNITMQPDSYIVPAPKIEEMKRPWLGDNFAIYLSHNIHQPSALEDYKEKWCLFKEMQSR